MYTTLTTLLDRLDSTAISGTNVIRWGSPVPSFGDLGTSKVATLGLNPSNREFVDDSGEELTGPFRRFHTLSSLRLRTWSDADSRHLKMIIETCIKYFEQNPYDRWFRKLENVISGTNASFYSGSIRACHLDIIPFATKAKWTELTGQQRTSLLSVSGDTLGLLIRDSPIRLLVLNGKSVVRHFEAVSGVKLDEKVMPSWALPRLTGVDIQGMAYQGEFDTLGGVALHRKVAVLGFNHNLQSSFGVTNSVISAIESWIGCSARRLKL